MQRLPNRIQELLTVFDDVSITKLAVVADKLWEHTTNLGATTSSISQQEDAIKKLAQQVSDLTTTMASLLQSRGCSRNSSRQRSNIRKRSVERQKTQDECYYHRRFGNKARKCVAPCSRSLDNTISDQGNAVGRRQQEQ